MTTALELVVATERHLLHHQPRERRNRLSSAYTSGGTSLALEHSEPLPSTGEQVQVDFELFHVWAGESQTPTVEGAQEGSSAANHDLNAHVVFSPKFPRHTILQALNDTLADLSSPLRGLWWVDTRPITFDAGVYGYDLDDDDNFLEMIDVAWRPVTSTEEWRSIPPRQWRIDRDLDPAYFPSGTQLVLPGGIPDGYEVQISYKAKYGSITSTAASVESIAGVQSSVMDIPPLGAAVRLLAGLEPARNYIGSQGSTRRAEEVPPGALDRSVRGLLALYEQRIKSESARLRAMYPLVRR